MELLRQQEGQDRGVLGQWERKGRGSARVTGALELWECYSSVRAEAAGAQGQGERYGLGAQGQRES